MAHYEEFAEKALAILDAGDDAGAGTTPATEEGAANEVLKRLDGGDAAPTEAEGETEADTTTEAVEAQPVAQDAPIEAPASWKAEWKDEFKTYPPELQRKIAERESERDRGLTKSQQESAEARKAAEAERAAVQAERQHYVARLTQTIDMAKVMDPIIAEGLKTDWVKLAAENPALALQRKFQFDERYRQLQTLEMERNATAERIRADKFREGHKLLSEKLDFWQDEGKRKAFQSELAKTLTDHYGFKPEEALEIDDPRAMIVARDAMLYRQLMAKQATIAPKKASPPARVMTTQAQTGDGKGEHAEALKRTALRTGRTEDVAAAVLASL